MFNDEMSFFLSLNLQHGEEVFVSCLSSLMKGTHVVFCVVYCERAHVILEADFKDQCDVYLMCVCS